MPSKISIRMYIFCILYPDSIFYLLYSILSIDLSPVRQPPRSPSSPHKFHHQQQESSPKFQRAIAFTIPATPDTVSSSSNASSNGISAKQLEFLYRQTQTENEELTKKLRAKEFQGKAINQYFYISIYLYIYISISYLYLINYSLYPSQMRFYLFSLLLI